MIPTPRPPSCFPTRLTYLSQVVEQPVHRALGLTDGELARIVDLLGREPNHFELAVFSLLWSEHCGYKHSALLLKRLPSSGKRVLQGPGENAGVLDLGDGEAVCFKVESHNHPSAVEPFQGAATGVGGILRDIIAMGARPIALLDGLRFAPDDPRFDRAVAGIGAYGNSVGVPTVGGEAVFDETYRDNVLVNAMCVGLLPADRVTRAGASGPGNLVVLYGATTGRDGIGGASVLASQELGEDDADKRPSVQVGDPFTGKKLIEVSVELVESGLVESLQDCGAAGLASSLSEMARDCGIDLRLDAVPLREEGMEPWEVMISESQERMVAVVRPQMLDAVLAVCERWELHHAVVGEVTDTGLLRALWADEVVGEIPARLLTDECPRYTVEPQPRAEPCRRGCRSTRRRIPRRCSSCSRSPNLRSREWIFRRYDHLVGSRTVRRPGLDAAVLRLRPGYRGLAVSLDGQSRMGRLWPRTGGRLAVLEAARNVACTGAEPIGLTDCLNFGNPEKGEIAWELAESIEGMAEACEALRVPIVSGNVSLYNETDGRAIDPTPVVGCVGLLEDVRQVPGAVARGRRDPARRRLAGRAGRLRVPGPLGPGRRPPCTARPRRRGRARRVPLARGAAVLARPRRLARRSRGRAGGGGDPLRPRRRAGAAGRPARVVRRGRRPGRARLLARRGRPARRRAAAAARRRRRRRSARPLARRAPGGVALVCGVFGIRSAERDVARLAYFGLFALQHRGQEAAGIAVSDRGRLTALRDMGLVAQVFDEEKLQALPGEVAIGHTRYSTTGSNAWANAQPLVHHGPARTVALAHNGNLTNTEALRDALAADGIVLGATSDTEAVAALIAHDPAPLAEAVARAMRRLEGAYSVVALADGKLVGFRDPHGIRPLALGRLGDDWVLASETCALDLIGAELRARGPAGRSRRDRRGRAARDAGRSRGPAGALHLRARLLRAPRLDARRAPRSTACACGWASGSRPRRPPTPTS